MSDGRETQTYIYPQFESYACIHTCIGYMSGITLPVVLSCRGEQSPAAAECPCCVRCILFGPEPVSAFSPEDAVCGSWNGRQSLPFQGTTRQTMHSQGRILSGKEIKGNLGVEKSYGDPSSCFLYCCYITLQHLSLSSQGKQDQLFVIIDSLQ